MTIFVFLLGTYLVGVIFTLLIEILVISVEKHYNPQFVADFSKGELAAKIIIWSLIFPVFWILLSIELYRKM